jgi:hypothetical protein
VLFGMLILVAHGIPDGGRRAVDRASASAEALRSTLIATEFLRYDLGRALLGDLETDISAMEDGRRLEVTIAGPTGADLNEFKPVRIAYFLQPVPGSAGAHRLVRQDGAGVRFVESCVLQDFRARIIPKGDVSALQAYLELTLVGTEGPQVRSRYISSALIPLRVPVEPQAYELIEGGNL